LVGRILKGSSGKADDPQPGVQEENATPASCESYSR
jgi:hypothetical protein